MTSPFAPIARAVRGDRTESWHAGVAAVVTPDGRRVARLGEPATATFLRSAAKPFQAMALLAAGGEAAFDLSDADVALACASHGGTPAHVERAASLLERGGFGPEDLLCGAHEPVDTAAARALRAAGRAPTTLHNNCSGKHAAMLLACRLRELPTAGYDAPDHPLQRENRERIARLCGLPERRLAVAVDGCSVPTFNLPVAAAARAWAVLADPEAAGLGSGEAAAARRVIRAMAAEPAMVAGPGRFTTRLIEATGGRVIGKEGAEGVYAVAVRGPAALGLVLKVADGGARCRDGVALELLRTTGSLSGEELERLESFHRPERRNHRGLLVGRIEPVPELVAWPPDSSPEGEMEEAAGLARSVGRAAGEPDR